MANTKKSPPTEPAAALYHRFEQRAAAFLRPGARVAVGYSGGLDSTVLLHLFSRLRQVADLDLQAFHLHHGLNLQADAWLAHCAEQCREWGIAFDFQRLALDPAAPDSLEARARAARYLAYAALECEQVALAHHRDDQVETVLYRLARGAGVHGAAGMPAVRPLGADKQVWRPLLEEARGDLLAYARHHGLRWVEDDSNACLDYDRNYLRREVVPSLVARFPVAPAAVARAARHFAEAAGLLDALAEQDAGGRMLRLPLDRLRSLSPPRQRNLLRWFLASHGLRPDERQLAILLGQLLDTAVDGRPCLRLGERQVLRYRDEIWLANRLQPAPVCPLSMGLTQRLPGWGGGLQWMRDVAGGMREDGLTDLVARPRQGGERIRLRPGGPTRQVKLLLQEAGIPPWLREHWPLLWRGDQLVAVADIGVAADYQASRGLWPAWRPDDWPDYCGHMQTRPPG